MRGRKWTDEDLEVLEKLWGVASLDTMSKRLNRSIAAIQTKATKYLGKKSECTGRLSASELARALNVDVKTVTRYRDKGLKTRRVGQYVMISIENFWDFAEKNKNIIKFYKFEKNTIPNEPSWVQEERKRQSPNNRRYKKWSNGEDRLLMTLTRSGKSTKEIAKEMNRTYEAILARKKILNIGFMMKLEKEKV